MSLNINLYMPQLNFLIYKFELQVTRVRGVVMCKKHRLHGLDYVVLWLVHLDTILMALGLAENMAEGWDP
jgi:hypothetical protein